MPLTETQIEAMTTVIREVAASEILPRFRNLEAEDIASKAHAADLVTIADQRAERAMTTRFQAILPGDTIIGEEAISEGTANLASLGAGRCVVIDPIDGTWNYAHGVSNYGVLVAVVEEGETVWGCCYDPIHDDWISATRGGGTGYTRGGQCRAIVTRPEAPALSEMRGNLGEYYMPPDQRQSLSTLIPKIALHSTLGASVMEYRVMCQSAKDFCLNAHLNVWDHAAGALCLAEAGGVSRLLDGRDYSPLMETADMKSSAYLLNARSPAVWEAMADQIRAHLG